MVGGITKREFRTIRRRRGGFRLRDQLTHAVPHTYLGRICPPAEQCGDGPSGFVTREDCTVRA